jgi:tetratricopeptide (TPR) repeat protein
MDVDHLPPRPLRAVELDVLHCVNAALVYFVARRLFASAGAFAEDAGRLSLAAGIAALLFAVHPLRAESVVWVTERRDVLSLAFMLASTLLYLRSTDREAGWARAYIAAVVLFAAALLAKATVVTLPVVLLILNVFPLRRLTFDAGLFGLPVRRVITELAPFLLLSLATGILSIVALAPGEQLDPVSKLSLSVHGIAFYLAKTVWPTGLSPLYEIPRDFDPLAVRYVAALVVVVALGVAAFRARHRWPAVSTALAVFVVVLFPLLGVVQNGPQFAADRYTYHASPALALLVAAGVVALPASRRSFALAIAAVAILALGALTWRQAGFWKSSETLWTRALAVGESSVARVGAGDLLLAEGNLDVAVSHYRRAIELDPNYVQAYNNLGVALARQGKLDEAVLQYSRATELKPDHFEAFNNWGVALSRAGRFDDAATRFERALAIRSDYADAQVNWGNALVRQGKPREAMAHYAAALRIDAGLVEAHLNGGVALAQLGDAEAASRAFQRVLVLDPGNADATEYLRRLRTP